MTKNKTCLAQGFGFCRLSIRLKPDARHGKL
jgi:hypothetical protein